MNNDEEYYIWGAGLLGERVLYHFAKWINIVGFIDRDVNKQKLNYMNMPVMSFEEYMKIKRKNPNAKVIIAILVGYQEIQINWKVMECMIIIILLIVHKNILVLI